MDSEVKIIESDALRANLIETSIKVEIPEEYNVLLKVVKNFKGLEASLQNLLIEICHPYHNWQMVLPHLRSFVLKNIHHYLSSEDGPECIHLFSGFFLEALFDARRNPQVSSDVVAGLMIWLEKMLSKIKPEDAARFTSVIEEIFHDLQALDVTEPALLKQFYQSPHTVKKLAPLLKKMQKSNSDFMLDSYYAFLRTTLLECYDYWLHEDDPMSWFLERCSIEEKNFGASHLFVKISHESLRKWRERVEKGELEPLEDLPDHIDIVRQYRAIPGQVMAEGGFQASDSDDFEENRKLLFLFKIMDTTGLSLIHEETLREINRSLVSLIRQQSFEQIEEFLLTAFQLLKANVRKYPHTSLQCIQVIGDEIFDRGNSRMVEAFLFGVVRFGFQHAGVAGVDDNWQPLVNPAHLANIRVWLHLIMREPKWCGTLFSALIIHLKLSGTCVKDTDLFQRDITNLLNHPIEPIYNLSKQFTKLMPVFFNEIGSEGELRDVSTELDEIHHRKDLLIHFLRKQGHVESSNLIVDFTQAILKFWHIRDKTLIIPYVPEDVYLQIATSGPLVDDLYILSDRLWSEFKVRHVPDILDIKNEDLKAWLAKQSDCDAGEVRRFELMLRMYALLNRKYKLGFSQLRGEIGLVVQDSFPELHSLPEQLDETDTEKILGSLLGALESLKETILSPKKFEVREDIYYKRHIAVDIPSVYGRYREKKFDALSLSFRLEKLANLYLEKLPETLNLSIITQATFYNISRCIRLYMRALSIDGISSRRLSIQLNLLESSLKVRRFSYTQYLDILRGMSEGVKDIIYSYYTNIHQNNLSIIIPQIGSENILNKFEGMYDEDDMAATIPRLSEVFMRELIASTFGLQHLDNFILRILQTLENQKNLLDGEKLDILMSYNPEKAISLMHRPNPYTDDLIHLGNKGYNLVNISRLGKQVPAAFIITTEIFRCQDVVFNYRRTRDEFMQRVRNALNEVERVTGRTFGSAENPLLLSVRSGGSISMPGMMATIHDVGLNEDIIEEYVAKNGNAYLAWDNYRRFVQSWGMISGMEREDFQSLMNAAKTDYGVGLKRDFSKAQMKELALSYRDLTRRRSISIPEDPWLQLINAIELVLESWNTEKAVEFRHIMDVSDSWGTAVIVQTMVLGNRSQEAGAGVVFTAHPYRKVQRVALWGDYAFGDQGEDIVSGLVSSCAISVEQAELDGRPVEDSLERRFPAIYKALLETSRELVYDNHWNPQEIEFTFESPDAKDLYYLQTRDMITIKKQEHLNVFVETEPGELEAAWIGSGVGVSGSALSGRAVFSEEDIARIRLKDKDSPLILIRQDTVPEDIKMISLAQGLLTARGGQTSHASVVAVRLEKCCVVGCRSMKVFDMEGWCELDGERINRGDHVSIDGRSGQVFKGEHAVREEYHIMPL